MKSNPYSFSWNIWENPNPLPSPQKQKEKQKKNKTSHKSHIPESLRARAESCNMCNTYKYILTCKWDTFGDEFSAHEIRLCIYFNGDDAPRLVLQKQECPPKLLSKYFLKPNFFLLHPLPMWSAAAASYTQHVLYTDVIQYLQTLLPVCNQFHRDYASWGYNCKICEQVLYEKLVMKLGIIVIFIMFCNNSSLW